MKLCSLSSGSSGNCVYIESDQSRILVDAGKSARQLQSLMSQAGLDPKRLDGIFVTHEHADHVQGVGVLSRRFHLPIFASEGTWQAMSKKLGRVDHQNQRIIVKDQPFSFRDLQVQPIGIYHDAIDPLAYTFRCGTEKVSVLTDTGVVDERILTAIRGSAIYYLEANHDVEMVLNGPYPPLLKDRILSARGHLSNHQAASILVELLEGRGEVVLLAHLSAENNTPELCDATIRADLMEAGLDPDRHLQLLIAPRHTPSPLFPCSRDIRKEACVPMEPFSFSASRV